MGRLIRLWRGFRSAGLAGRYCCNGGGGMVVRLRGGRAQYLRASTGTIRSCPAGDLKLCVDDVLADAEWSWLLFAREQLYIWKPCWERNPPDCPVRQTR